MSDISAIQGWFGEVQSTMSGLGAEMEAAAPTGDFAQVFSSAQSILDDEPGSSTSSASASSTTATSTASTPTGTGSTSALLASAGSATSTTTGATVVSTAEKYLGVPYVWGGTTPTGFDCSGFTQYVYAQLGITIPRTSQEQSNVGTPVDSVADAEPGDLVFYPGTDGTAASPGHVGIYIGNGEMINAPETGTTVSITAVGDPTAIRRVLTPSSSLNANISGALANTIDASSSSPDATAGVATTASTGTGTDPTAATSTGTDPTAAASSPAALDVPSQYASLFTAAAAQYGVPVNLLASMAQVESNYNPNAVSSAGAEGLMQLMPSVASGLGVNPYDPAQAVDGAAQLMASYLAQYHSTADALAAYNAGPNAVAQYGGVPPYGQTQAYVTDVMQLAGISS